MSDEKQSEWTTYWNRVNLARRSRIPDATNHTKPVLNDLVSRGDKGTGISHNFLRVLADDMGVSHDVYERGLKPLREAGVVEVTRQHNARGHPTMSRYRVVDEALLALAPKTQLAFREEPTKTQPAFQEALPKTQNAGRLKRKNGPPETQLASHYCSHITNPKENSTFYASREKELEEVRAKDPAGSQGGANGTDHLNGADYRTGEAHAPSQTAAPGAEAAEGEPEARGEGNRAGVPTETAQGAAEGEPAVAAEANATGKREARAWVRADGLLTLSAEERARWLPEFDNDPISLDMALMEAGGYVRLTRGQPLLPQVHAQLERINRETKERAARSQAAYRAAVAASGRRPPRGRGRPDAPAGSPSGGAERRSAEAAAPAEAGEPSCAAFLAGARSWAATVGPGAEPGPRFLEGLRRRLKRIGMSADELIADWYDVKAGRRFASTAEAERNLAAYV